LEDDDRAKYLFLSLLQARVGSSLVAHLGNLAPEAVLRTPVVELAGRAKISEGLRALSRSCKGPSILAGFRTVWRRKE
jgi:hypothetical protein